MKRKPKLVGFKVGSLTLKSGDYLVVKSPGPITDGDAKRIKEHFEIVFKDRNVKTIVLGDGLDLLKLEIKK